MSTINQLYPVFLKLNQVKVLIVGGGNVAREKLSFLLKNSPDAQVKVVAPEINSEITDLVLDHQNVKAILKPFDSDDLNGVKLVLSATNSKELNGEIKAEANQRNILANVADTPDLCDFYLGSIVTKGDLKVAISTNGKSPTFAKRFREILEEIIPDNLPDTLNNLAQIRSKLTGSFAQKVKELNTITANLINHERN